MKRGTSATWLTHYLGESLTLRCKQDHVLTRMVVVGVQILGAPFNFIPWHFSATLSLLISFEKKCRGAPVII